MSKYYFIEPKNKGSNSKRWMVDEEGLAYIKNHYKNYSNRAPVVDRWHEFKHKEIREVYFDFGGGIFIDTPDIKLDYDGITFALPCTHFLILLEALAKPNLRKRGVWLVNPWMISCCFGIETVDKLLAAFKEREDEFKKMGDDFYKEKLESIK